MKIRNTCLSLLLAAPFLSQPADAALAVTNGTFGASNQNGRTVDGGGWFESTTSTDWIEGSHFNGGRAGAYFSGPLLLMDGLGDNSYVYQSLGTVGLADIAQGSLNLAADFSVKSDGATNTALFQIFAGAFAPAASGVDIFGHASQPALIASFVMDSTAQGLNTLQGQNAHSSGMLIGNVNLSGIADGTQLWLRITDAADGTDNSGTGGDFMMDNLTATVVPEPSVALLGGLGALALLRRRRA